MSKAHNHSEQFDGAMHSVCGQGFVILTNEDFEGFERKLRCKHCERDWFPNGQPDWHWEQAAKKYQVKLKKLFDNYKGVDF